MVSLTARLLLLRSHRRVDPTQQHDAPSKCSVLWRGQMVSVVDSQHYVEKGATPLSRTPQLRGKKNVPLCRKPICPNGCWWDNKPHNAPRPVVPEIHGLVISTYKHNLTRRTHRKTYFIVFSGTTGVQSGGLFVGQMGSLSGAAFHPAVGGFGTMGAPPRRKWRKSKCRRCHWKTPTVKPEI